MRTLAPRLLLALALAAVVLAGAAAPLAAATLAGVTLPDKADVDGHSLVLNGIALRTRVIIKVYVAGLYLTQKQGDAAKVLAADQPRRMVMHFLYNVKKEQMCDAWEEGLEANTPNASPQVKKDFATLCSWMDGVGKGQQLALTYVPGKGTTVELGGKAKGTLPGKPTADAILSTWIGPDPAPGEDFKQALLGGK